jgi:hypothetical protein
VARLDHGDHQLVGERRIERPMRRVQIQIDPALVAPALQFEDPIALAHRVAFGERQSAGLREQVDQRHRTVINLAAIVTCDLHKEIMADIGPRRLQGKIIVNLARHAGFRTVLKAMQAPSQQTAAVAARRVSFLAMR